VSVNETGDDELVVVQGDELEKEGEPHGENGRKGVVR